MRLEITMAVMASSTLAACTTTSFAPPATRVGHVLSRTGADVCDLSQIADDKNGKKRKIKRNASGALKLVNNFILTYRCSARSAANGRRYFQVPSFLAVVGGATAAALGAGPDVAIATGSGAAALNGANGYFAPKEKAYLLNSALDALVCIKSEAVGISAFSSQIDASEENNDDDNSLENMEKSKNGGKKIDSADEEGDVVFPIERRYFEMIGAALYSVERITAGRMNSIGALDTGSLVNEIKALASEAKDAEIAKDTQQVDAQGSQGVSGGAANAEKGLSEAVATNSTQVGVLKARVNFNTSLKLDVLQPKLQLCVLRAKL